MTNVEARSVPLAEQPSNITRSSVSWQQPASQSTTQHHAAPSTWGSYFDVVSAEPSLREIALLRQFRYRTAPWLEAGDPDSQFGVAMMRLAQEHENLRALVAELASAQLLHPFDATRMHGARNQLSNATSEIEFVADAIVSLAETLCTGPVAWKQFLFRNGETNGAMYDMGQPLQTLRNQESHIGMLAFRILSARASDLTESADLAASILSSRPPATDRDYYLVQHSVSERGSTFSSAYNWTLYHLTSCLHFVFRISSTSLEAASASPVSPGTFPRPGASLDWHNLWLRTQAWYDTRPVEMQSLVDVGSIEMSRIDPMNPASFPIHLYSSAIAVQAAIFYHMNALLLLQHKPRLLNIPGRRQHLTSPNWHARAIAGIATSNEFTEQWDPIVVASLIYIASNITHSAQQHAILECLAAISVQTGIPLEVEAEQLRTQWSAASLVEGPGSR